MNSLFQENKRTFLLLVVLFFLLLITLYFTIVQPKTGELQAVKNRTMDLEAEIEILNMNIAAHKDSQPEKTRGLEKKITLTPELEQLLHTIQQLEGVANSRIEAIDFTYDHQLSEIQVEAEEKTNESSSTEEDVEVEEIAPEQTFIGLNAPEHLHPITASMTVLAPDYEHFLKFLKAIEKLERLTSIDELDFLKPAEQALLFEENPDETIAFTIKITTFYYDQTKSGS